MKITFYTREIEIDDQTRMKIREKFDRLSRYFSKTEKYQNEDSINIEIHIDYQKGMYNVKSILYLDGKEIVLKDTANNLIDVINSIVDSMEIKLSKHKDKLITRHRVKIIEPTKSESQENSEVEIIRKRSEIPVISEKKAINIFLQDKNLNYFIFYNRDTDKINFLTKSDDSIILTEVII